LRNKAFFVFDFQSETALRAGSMTVNDSLRQTDDEKVALNLQFCLHYYAAVIIDS